jgi:hypothetical protein
MKTIKEEWAHIALYKSAEADVYKTVLEVAPELTTATKEWLQAKYVIANKERLEAEKSQKGL